ncbi:MAG: HAMP domain-containing histidine kinase [Clostridiales bacterium]|jgi:signal transduction histidine kinase|nr:HAMP domain-containing histidine kinase [Clostridiales bacterium]
MSENKNSIIQELAMIAHEFRRPIDTISKSAELVNRARETGTLELDKLAEIMDGIINSCHRMSLLTSQVTGMAQLENGTFRIMVEKLNVADFIRDLERLISLYEDKKNVKFTFDVHLKNPFAVCDFRKLEKILLNLISNAVKYSGKTDRRVAVKVYDEGDDLYFRVRDRGIGIPPAEQENIFKLFYRVEGFSTRQTEGCGLGLTMVKSLTEALGGAVCVVSREGKGSEFTVKLPRNQDVSPPSKIVEVAYSYQLYRTSIDEIFSDI